MAEIRNVFDIAGRSMAAQLVRLNTIASNLANAGNVADSEETAYRAMKPVFVTQYADTVKESGISTTSIEGITTTDRKPERVYMPNHPIADESGFGYQAAVNIEEEFIEMTETNRQYQNNVATLFWY